jgi:hypothetical protein
LSRLLRQSGPILLPFAFILALCLSAVAVVHQFALERPACSGRIVQPQALPWLEEMRARDLAGCEASRL